jgi:hypothetical protein
MAPRLAMRIFLSMGSCLCTRVCCRLNLPELHKFLASSNETA